MYVVVVVGGLFVLNDVCINDYAKGCMFSLMGSVNNLRERCMWFDPFKGSA